jgi:hypothetical protein
MRFRAPDPSEILNRPAGDAKTPDLATAHHFCNTPWEPVGSSLATLFLWPDISMLGYLVTPKLGSRLYNLVHTEVLPAALAASSSALHRTSLLAFALIWLISCAQCYRQAAWERELYRQRLTVH